MLPPDALVKEFVARGGAFEAGSVMFCGTLATIDAIRPSARFEMELHDPVLGRTIRHAYRSANCPIRSDRMTVPVQGVEADDLRHATMRRVSWRLLPLLFALFVASFLDRTNLGVASLQMNADLALSATAYALGAGVFYFGYALFEVPSNLILARDRRSGLDRAHRDHLGRGGQCDDIRSRQREASTRCGSCSGWPRRDSSRA